GRPWRRCRHRTDNQLCGPWQVRSIDDILMTFRMDDHLPIRIPLAEIVYVHGLKHLVHTAMALPEDELRALDRLTRIASVGLIGVPDDHGLSRQPHLVGRIA